MTPEEIAAGKRDLELCYHTLLRGLAVVVFVTIVSALTARGAAISRSAPSTTTTLPAEATTVNTLEGRRP